MSKHNSNIPKNDCTVVILAAGHGKRMQSDLPKPLQSVAGTTILNHLLSSIFASGFFNVVIVCQRQHQGAFLQTMDTPPKAGNISWAYQETPKGTADAVQSALPLINTSRCLIVLGDTPFVPSDIIETAALSCSHLNVVTTTAENPCGFGRIIRNPSGKLSAIIEEKDLRLAQKEIQEVNTGIIAVDTALLRDFLPAVGTKNTSKEYHLTEVVHHLSKEKNIHILTTHAPLAWKVLGANTRQQLIHLEQQYSLEIARKLIAQGVHIRCPEQFHCRGRIICGKNVVIDINVIVEGTVYIGDNCKIGASCILKDVTIGRQVHILPFSHLENTAIGDQARIGPYSYCRPDTQVDEQAQVGCFVETKSTHLKKGSKAKHLSYIGNLVVGTNSNIGAGVIHCNYDGLQKHHSTIASNCFIGANSSLVGPITIGNGSTVAAGSVITKSVPDITLAIARSPQKAVTGWVKKNKIATPQTEC